MIDLHCHILPALDDGPADWSESLHMAKIAAKDGIKEVVCTPHCHLDLYPNNRELILKKADRLREKLAEQNSPLQIHPGSEIHVNSAVLPKLQAGEILTLNDTGSYALIELPFEVIPPHMEDFFWHLMSQEITPVIAHPEKNTALIRDPAPLYDWVCMGAFVQITCSSLLAGFGPRPKDLAVQLLEHDMAHILATDAHGSSKRRPLLRRGRDMVGKISGEGIAARMVEGTPRGIIQGEAMTPKYPTPFNNKKRQAFSLKRCLTGLFKGSK